MSRIANNDYRFTYTVDLGTDCDLYTHLTISDDMEMSPASDGDTVVGILYSKELNFQRGTVAFTKYTEIDEIIFAGTVAAGDYVKLGTDGTGGEQRFAKWVSGTDDPTLIAGVCLKGGAVDETGYILC